MEEMSKGFLTITLPLWSALAVIVAFTVYYIGLTGIVFAFVIVIVATYYWYKVLEMFLGRTQDKSQKTPSLGSIETRLKDIESRLDEISTKMND